MYLSGTFNAWKQHSGESTVQSIVVQPATLRIMSFACVKQPPVSTDELRPPEVTVDG